MIYVPGYLLPNNRKKYIHSTTSSVVFVSIYYVCMCMTRHFIKIMTNNNNSLKNNCDINT